MHSNDEVIPVRMAQDDIRLMAMARFFASQGFLADYFNLTVQERNRFRHAWQSLSQTLDATGQLPAPPLVEKMTGYKNPVIYELRWDNSNAHKRATFHIDDTVQNSPIIVWRHMGGHEIYRNP